MRTVYFFRDRDRDDRRDGTLPPARRASLRPMATACLRLVTRLPDRPERSWPRFISCIARSTFWPALRPYRRPPLEVRLLRLVLRLDDRLRLDVRLLRPARLVRLRPVLRLRLDLRCAMEPP
jgi:hypothetical protein